jgi:hypothetical protein
MKSQGFLGEIEAVGKITRVHIPEPQRRQIESGFCKFYDAAEIMGLM